MKFFETLLSGLKAIILSHSYSKKDSDAKYLTKDKQAQPDWNESNKKSPAYIKNKPNIDTIHEELVESIPYEYPKNTIDVLTEVDGHLALVGANTLYTDCLVFAEYMYANGNACNKSFAQAREIVQNWLNAYSRTKYAPKPPILYEVRYRENTWSPSYFPMFVAHCIWCNYDNTRDEITCDFLIANGSGNQIQRVVMTNIGNITFDRRDVALTTDVNARFDSFLWKPVPEYIEVLRSNSMTFDGTQQQLSRVYSVDISNKVLEGARVRISVKSVNYETTIVRDNADPTNGLYASITTDEGYEYTVYFHKDAAGIKTNETGSHRFSVSAYLADKMPERLLPNTVVTEQYVDEAIAGLGGGVTSWNDLEDKPFGVKTEMVEIVPEQSVTGEYMPAEDGYPAGYSLNMPMDIGMLKVGGKYTVVFNGKTYNVEASSRGSEDVWLPLDGIHDIMYYEANNEPVEWVMSMMWEEDLGETITLAIYEEQEVVKQINPKFLPFTNAEAEVF